jgi:hypothetical protein
MSGWLVSATMGWCVIVATMASAAAAAELVGRFRDAPGRALRTVPGLAYIALNGLVAAVMLVALRRGSPPSGHFAILEQVLLACLITRIVARLRITGLKAADGSLTETGPGQFSERMQAAIARDLTREKANMRLRVVSEQMVGMDYEIAYGFIVSEMMSAMQELTDSEKKDVAESLAVIDSRKDLDDDTRLDMLGYLVLDTSGKDFLEQLVKLYFVRYPRRPMPVAQAA